ncbi:MAG: ATP phosphoribosyltransferase regulatory subunit [Myxococcales bacterium]|nr:ATP phosphoribosyltransferase regulatory subunit [Myxococcales bacterium]
MGEQGPFGSPRGARELMPPASGRRQRVVHALIEEFEAWGYARVETPLVEYYDVIARGLTEADRAQCVRFIEAGTGTVVALRSDVTPQIARMAACRIGGELRADAVHRFCYAADVVRQPDGSGEQTEQHQVGVELLGDGDAWADVELVALCDAALRRVGLREFSIDVAHAQLARTILDALSLPEAARAAVQGRLARKDRDGVAAVLSQAGVDPARAIAVASLCDRVGTTAVVERARAELGGLLPEAIIGALAGLVDAVASYDARLSASLVVDLGETRGFDYYSGVRLRVWAPGVPRPVVRGGRYDGMLARYGAPRPATGFAIDLDALEQALAEPGTLGPAAPVHVIALAPGAPPPVRALAARLARRARESGARAWVQHSTERALAEREATAAGAVALTWLTNDAGATRVQVCAWDAGQWHTVEQRNEAP